MKCTTAIQWLMLHRIMEMATGMHYLKNGQWVESQEEITILPDGTAAATEGQHQVYFPANIYDGVIEVVTPDWEHLKSRPIGLSYWDGQNSVLIAELKSSVGVLVSSNQIIYPDAFADIKADLRYTYTRTGFEQDVILREQPVSPADTGVDAQNTVLQMLTEFFDTPGPVQREDSVSPLDGLADTTLQFGSMTMVQGKAFSVDGQPSIARQSPKSRVSVYKSWAQIDGRAVLIEQVPFQKISEGLRTLPVATDTTASRKTSNLSKIAKKLVLPPFRLAQKTSTNTVQLAGADLKNSKGVVLDYLTLTHGETNYTFQADITYYISAGINLAGTTTFEGGTVLKFGPGAALYLAAGGKIDCRTEAYRPALLTSLNDNTAGDTIAGSSGNPNIGDVDNILTIEATNIYIHDLRIAHCYEPIYILNVSSLTVENCQFFDVGFFEVYNIWLRNVLIANQSDGTPVVYAYGTNVRGEHITADNRANNGGYFVDTSTAGSSLNLTNCLVTGQGFRQPGSTGLVSTQSVYCLPSAAGIYQSLGSGNYYLATNSIYRDAGATNLDPTVLADIRSRTTFPPAVYTASTLAGGTYSPTVQRDTNAPDIGYHYDPLDYVFSGMSMNSNVTMTAGTAIAWYNAYGHGIDLAADYIALTFNGTASQPCVQTGISAVQEGQTWTDLESHGIEGVGPTDDQVHAPHVVAQFTHFSVFGFRGNHICDVRSPVIIQANNSEFMCGGMGGWSSAFFLTNCLVDRTFVSLMANTAPAFVMRNCTTIGNTWHVFHTGGTWPIWIVNSAFDGTDVSSMDDVSGGDTNILYCNYNAFLTNAPRLSMLGANDVIVTNFNWQAGPLGFFYEPPDSPLINAGSMSSTNLGLYHFTTQTNQAKEANSIVDIGYHYVAVDANGNPIDSNGDGIPDYLQDANGNGVIDGSESPFAITIDKPINGASIGK